MKGCLILLGLVLLALVIWVFTQNGNSLSGGSASRPSSASADINCRSDQTVLTGIVGIGVNYSRNVSVSLKDTNRRTVIPSNRQQSVTDDGTPFESMTYLEGRVQLGTYTVEVTHDGEVVETYTLRLTRTDSPVITILCS